MLNPEMLNQKKFEPGKNVEPRNKGEILKMSSSSNCYYLLLPYNSFTSFLSKMLNQQNKIGVKIE